MSMFHFEAAFQPFALFLFALAFAGPLAISWRDPSLRWRHFSWESIGMTGVLLEVLGFGIYVLALALLWTPDGRSLLWVWDICTLMIGGLIHAMVIAGTYSLLRLRLDRK